MAKKKEERKLVRLPDSELEVMQAVWDSEQPVPRAKLEELMAERHPMAQTTLLTLLTRLADKGFVKIEKAGRGSVYTALVDRGEYLSDQSRSFIDRLCGGKMSVFAAALCDSGLTKEELDELRELIERSGR
ncbi:MAG: BlaI/MecI/CopY family transcriptional regulator [Lachnospiraceae bacterium]|nr:BlaI/MecI/CopY family transcriptional regulator [Lachnospiraceae bacterium]